MSELTKKTRLLVTHGLSVDLLRKLEKNFDVEMVPGDTQVMVEFPEEY